MWSDPMDIRRFPWNELGRGLGMSDDDRRHWGHGRAAPTSPRPPQRKPATFHLSTLESPPVRRIWSVAGLVMVGLRNAVWPYRSPFQRTGTATGLPAFARHHSEPSLTCERKQRFDLSQICLFMIRFDVARTDLRHLDGGADCAHWSCASVRAFGYRVLP